LAAVNANNVKGGSFNQFSCKCCYNGQR